MLQNITKIWCSYSDFIVFWRGNLALLTCSLSFHRCWWLSMLLIHFIVHRLPISVLEVSKKMLTESSRNPVAAIVEKEAGWYLLSSLLASMPREVYSCLCILNLSNPLGNFIEAYHHMLHLNHAGTWRPGVWYSFLVGWPF